ncbi:hypothetical protein [Marinobacter sp.]|uniref:hypothetical protein n=1 Tax=Marinobacter sp. TaxID=50741 RepID=UPI003B5304BA
MPGTIRSHIMALADRYAVHYEPTPDDALAEIATRLSGDEVVTEEMEDLLVALKRAGAISGAEMVDLLGLYLTDKYQH